MGNPEFGKMGLGIRLIEKMFNGIPPEPGEPENVSFVQEIVEQEAILKQKQEEQGVEIFIIAKSSQV